MLLRLGAAPLGGGCMRGRCMQLSGNASECSLLARHTPMHITSQPMRGHAHLVHCAHAGATGGPVPGSSTAGSSDDQQRTPQQQQQQDQQQQQGQQQQQQLPGRERIAVDGRLIFGAQPAPAAATSSGDLLGGSEGRILTVGGGRPATSGPTRAYSSTATSTARSSSSSDGSGSHRDAAAVGSSTSTSARPAPLPTPSAPPMTATQLDELVGLITSARRVLLLTGAGVSTESGTPDYRGPAGAYTTGFTPMTHQQFMAAEASRARYWARGFAGWPTFSTRRANAAHEGFARLQSSGWVGDIITQNVDRLHQAAGASRVIELHGTTHEVVCTRCGELSCRHNFQSVLASVNPDASVALAAARMARAGGGAGGGGKTTGGRAAERWVAEAERYGTAEDRGEAATVPLIRPDGDVELADAGAGFVVPACGACGGVLKPHVVFFGDGIPKARANAAMEAAKSCDLVLAAGTSLMVYSAFRLVEAAHKAGARVAAINVGPTRADKLLTVKFEVLAGEAAMKLATHPDLLLPRIH
ncbi:hypothetical protein FOA52_002448 [Chlamydomonas sp. UWO 241]|nr:hypothetical protein FOA52_002448 [Chlamydomonas sp. UWO 241]